MKLGLRRSFKRLPRRKRPRGARSTSKPTKRFRHGGPEEKTKPEVKKIPKRPGEKKDREVEQEKKAKKEEESKEEKKDAERSTSGAPVQIPN